MITLTPYGRKCVGTSLCWTLVVGAAALLTGCATSRPISAARAEPVTLADCKLQGVSGKAMCGTIEVWENRAAKRGRRIPLNVVVLKALSATPVPDPLFTFAGGPGQGEAADAADNAERFEDIRRDRDIVMIDQRGTGLSNPLNCTVGGLPELVKAYLAGEMPVEPVRTCRDRLKTKADLRLYTTPIAIDDADEVRQRLGYERINLYGGSYGSRAALVYLARHRAHVRTATLRAVFPLSLRNPLHSPRDAHRALNRLFADCAAELRCSASYPLLAAKFLGVLERLARSPIPISVPGPAGQGEIAIPITRSAFAGIVRRMLYHPRTQAMIPLVIERAAAGDLSPLKPLIAQAAGIERALSLGMFLSVTCAEDVARIRQYQIRPASAGAFTGETMVRSLLAACSVWPRGELPSSYSRAVRSDAPVLLLSGTLDPMTPPHYGAEVARTLPNSRHVVMEGVAHGPFPPCAIAIMTEVVRSGSTASLDTACLGDLKRPPFDVSKQ